RARRATPASGCSRSGRRTNRWKASSRTWWSDERSIHRRSHARVVERAPAFRQASGRARAWTGAHPAGRRAGIPIARFRLQRLERSLSHRPGAGSRDRRVASADGRVVRYDGLRERHRGRNAALPAAQTGRTLARVALEVSRRRRVHGGSHGPGGASTLARRTWTGLADSGSAVAARGTRRGIGVLLRRLSRARCVVATRACVWTAVRRRDRDGALAQSHRGEGNQRARVFAGHLAETARQQRGARRQAGDHRHYLDDGDADAGGRGRTDPLEGAGLRGGGALVTL